MRGFRFARSAITVSVVLTAPAAYAQSYGYQTNTQPYCREQVQTIRVGGVWQQGYGTACYQPDGSWQMVSTQPTYAPPQYVPPPVTQYVPQTTIVTNNYGYNYYTPPPRAIFIASYSNYGGDGYGGRGGYRGAYGGGWPHGWRDRGYYNHSYRGYRAGVVPGPYGHGVRTGFGYNYR